MSHDCSFIDAYLIFCFIVLNITFIYHKVREEEPADPFTLNQSEADRGGQDIGKLADRGGQDIAKPADRGGQDIGKLADRGGQNIGKPADPFTLTQSEADPGGQDLG